MKQEPILKLLPDQFGKFMMNLAFESDIIATISRHRQLYDELHQTLLF
jgi:hypothetical protein